MLRIRAIGLDRNINNYESFELGSNYKMSEVTAILAILHTENANDLISERQYIAKRYDDGISFNEKLSKFYLPDNTTSCYYKYYMYVDKKKTRERLITYCKSFGIDMPPFTYERLCSQQKISNSMNCVTPEKLINSLYLTSHIVCLPMYNGLKEKEIDYIVKVLNSFIEAN